MLRQERVARESALYRVWNGARWRGRRTLDVERDPGCQHERIGTCTSRRCRLAPLRHGPYVDWPCAAESYSPRDQVVLPVYPHEHGRHGFPGEWPVVPLDAPQPPEQVLQSPAVLDDISVYKIDCTDGKCQLCQSGWRDKTRQCIRHVYAEYWISNRFDIRRPDRERNVRSTSGKWVAGEIWRKKNIGC